MTIFGTSIPDGLYIRQEYWDLHDIIKQRLRSDRSLRRILVVGSPGIGKSVFGVFLLLLFMTEQKDVAYRRLGDKVIYFTWNADGYKCSRTPYAGRTYDGLFDGNEAGEALWLSDFDRAFLFANPCTKNYNEFVKAVCFKMYMNPWTKDDCQRFADAMKLEDQDEWLRRFNLVGGKPRFLFSSSETSDDLVQRVKEDIPHNLDELKDQVRLFQQKVFEDRMKHIVFHLYRNENAPSRAYLAYSSLTVEAIMNARYKVGSADEIRALLQTPAPNLQSWRGKEIEKFLLQELATSKFCMRALEGSGVGTVTRHGPLNAASEIIQASSEIQNELVLYIPLSKTFPAIDGVLVVPQDGRIIYAQSTVATAHPIKYQQLKNVYQDLTQRQEFQGYTHILLFIVSNEIYDGFTVQSYKNADGKNRTARVDIDVTQYVGKISRQ
ncbi:hypothetical protein F442_05035 [Phytophthora nicotianae P10297]|uniref:Uncharacterized protein n=4 Tax=Phytophthora nicotianae TaxID=4792 RepID=V9FL01_PHYNI|nr:hypothetical protein F443_04969 [Phytophthora nicotianae P1569]ETM51360.1 hypothetical protein L914_04787 [Phytophthora nicotianae]ETO80476.1 hypothetical protein F444_05017 [Phytophthora nicotianae P1976]ETP49417.1 hypothetical protein F442_05035 [Phytophthora nicotianae P10297]